MLSSHGGRGHNKERIKGIYTRERERLTQFFSFEEEENFKSVGCFLFNSKYLSITNLLLSSNRLATGLPKSIRSICIV